MILNYLGIRITHIRINRGLPVYRNVLLCFYLCSSQIRVHQKPGIRRSGLLATILTPEMGNEIWNKTTISFLHFAVLTFWSQSIHTEREHAKCVGNSFDIAGIQCEHSLSQQQVPFTYCVCICASSVDWALPCVRECTELSPILTPKYLSCFICQKKCENVAIVTWTLRNEFSAVLSGQTKGKCQKAFCYVSGCLVTWQNRTFYLCLLFGMVSSLKKLQTLQHDVHEMFYELPHFSCWICSR